VTGMDLGFGGEVADLYHRYRHGYPSAAIDMLAETFGLNAQDMVVDVGCGTGQLTLPIARRVRAVIGMDPEPDMLRRARRAARNAQVSNVCWMLDADTDVPALTFDQLVGGIYSAMPVDRLPAPDQRPAFAKQLRRAVGPHERFTEPVHVAILTGRTPGV
jgi:SAM-dependent methyltransferase